jgi:hypothetical protein
MFRHLAPPAKDAKFGLADLDAWSLEEAPKGFKISGVRGVVQLLAAGVMAFTVAAAAGQLALMQAGPAGPAQPTAVVWGGRVFTNRTALERWLAARGASYEAWARRHQAIARRFEMPPASALSRRTKRPGAAVATHRRTSRSLATTGLVVGAAVLLSGGIVFLLRRKGRTATGVTVRHLRKVRPDRIGVELMPLPRNLRGLIPRIGSLKPPAALFARGTVRAAHSSRRWVAHVGMLGVNELSPLVPTSNGSVRLRGRARIRRMKLRQAAAYALWLVASGLAGAAIVFSLH